MKVNKNILTGLLVGFAIIFCMGAVAVNQWQVFRQPVTFGAVTYNTVGNGTKASVTGLTVKEYGTPILHKTVLKFDDVSIVMDDVSGASTSGGKKIYDFPAGSIVIVGAEVDVTGLAGAGGISNSADGDVGVGTVVANTTNTLSSTEQDIISTTEIAQFASGTGPVHAQKAAASFHDGTSTAKDVYLNFLFDDADSSADDTLTVNGTVTLYWLNQGDY